MDILITGGAGLLGSDLAAHFAAAGADVVSCAHATSVESDRNSSISWRTVDVRDESAVETVVEDASPDWVVNCAAMTDVDGCERNSEAAFDVNANGAENVARAASKIDARTCQVSTDYVFGDSESSPHEHGESLSPMQVYGQSKAEGERRVRERADSPLIARVSFLYGRNSVSGSCAGVVPWILSKQVDDPIPLYTDQRVSPTNAIDAAETIAALIEAGESGAFHCNNAGCVSPLELGEYVFRKAGRDRSRLVESSLAEVDRPAPRPMASCLETGHTEAVLSRPQPGWREGVDSFFRRCLGTESE